jgi:hypothetical protein
VRSVLRLIRKLPAVGLVGTGAAIASRDTGFLFPSRKALALKKLTTRTVWRTRVLRR